VRCGVGETIDEPGRREPADQLVTILARPRHGAIVM
jgi:hypothetical protein